MDGPGSGGSSATALRHREAMRKIANVPLIIDGTGAQTLQEQIYSNIKRSIVQGVIGPDHRLPSTRALAAQLGVSRTTVLIALEQLQAEGYLVTRERSGIFVAGVLPDQVVGQEIPSAPLQSRHPLLSMRGRMLAESRAPDRRLAGT